MDMVNNCFVIFFSKKKHIPISKVKIEKTRKPFLFTCELCNKKFRYPERFEAHQLEHEGKRVSIPISVYKPQYIGQRLNIAPVF